MAEAPEARAGREHRLPRIPKWALVTALILLGLIALGAIAPALSQLQHVKIRLSPIPPEYQEIMRPRRGFYMGRVAGDVLVFVFYEHPQYGLYPVLDGDLVPTNELIFYLFSWHDHETRIVLDEYILEVRVQGNTTVELKLDERTYEESIYLPARRFVSLTVQLAEAKVEKRLDVYVQGSLIMRLRHKTFPAFTGVGFYTLGSLEKDRAAFIGLAATVCLIALAFSRATISRVKYVPDIPRWLEVGLFFAGLAAIGAAWWLITYFALIRALHLLIPVGIVAYFYGLYLMRQKPVDFYLTRMHVGAGQPRKDIEIKSVVRKRLENVWELAPETWREFFKFMLGHRRLLKLRTADGREPLWYIDLGDGDREYIFQDMEEDEHGDLVVTVAPLHALDVERWTYMRLGVEDLARDKETLRRQLHEVRARMELEIDRRTQENIRYYWELRRRSFLGRRGPVPPALPAEAGREAEAQAPQPETQPEQAGEAGEASS